MLFMQIKYYHWMFGFYSEYPCDNKCSIPYGIVLIINGANFTLIRPSFLCLYIFKYNSINRVTIGQNSCIFFLISLIQFSHARSERSCLQVFLINITYRCVNMYFSWSASTDRNACYLNMLTKFEWKSCNYLYIAGNESEAGILSYKSHCAYHKVLHSSIVHIYHHMTFHRNPQRILNKTILCFEFDYSNHNICIVIKR